MRGVHASDKPDRRKLGNGGPKEPCSSCGKLLELSDTQVRFEGTVWCKSCALAYGLPA